MTPHALPRSILENPPFAQWVDFGEPGVVRVFSAKVELGQGIVTAIAQIAAEELSLPIAQVVVVSGDTRYCPDESYAAGSMSIEIGGTSMRIACAAARQEIVEHAARMLRVDVTRITVEGGRILLDGAASSLDYWQVAPHVDWITSDHGSSRFQPPAERGLDRQKHRASRSSRENHRRRIHPRLRTARDVARARAPAAVVRRAACLTRHSAVERLPGFVKIWRNGDFVGVCCEREYQAVKALEALRTGARWLENEVFPVPNSWAECLPTLRTIDSETEIGSPPPASQPPAPPNVRRLSATYSKPMLAHASMAPSCAVASYDEGQVTVWTHSQGVFPLRGSLAATLGIDEQAISVIHVQGAGVYGHNGADDVALDAALLARQVPSRPVRVQWMRDDELAWSSFGSPMVVKIDGAVTPAGDIADWSLELWSGPHAQRPRSRDAVNLLAAAHLDPPVPSPAPDEVLAGFMGGDRNSQAPYDLPRQRIMHHKVPGLPFRLSALRTLGGYANVFAIESFMDELADAAHIDPVRFRLRHLSDARARRVIETVARLSGWQFDAESGAGRAAGIGFSRYKNTAAYVAVVADVEIAANLRVSKVYCAVDAGLVINPDGVTNQIEGGIVQSISWTLKEQVGFDGRRVTTRSFEEYPIIRFDEVPEVRVELIDSPDTPPLGVGEAAQGPAAAAVANAVARALGFRIRDLPITRDRIIAAIAR